MRKLLFFLLFPAALASHAQGTAQDSVWIRENYYKIERNVPMRDGVKLFTSIYMPKDTTAQHPILMTRTPYSCAPYGEDKWKNYTPSYVRYYLREGYIIIIQDVRGRWMSEGQFVDVRPFIKDKKATTDVDEASDTYDAIDWLVKNVPHNNGRRRRLWHLLSRLLLDDGRRQRPSGPQGSQPPGARHRLVHGR